MSTYLLITPKEDELYHYGVKGMKWRVKKGMSAQGGAAVTFNEDDVREAEENARNELDAQERVNQIIARMSFASRESYAFHRAVGKTRTAKLKSKVRELDAKRKKYKEKASKMTENFKLQQSDSDEDFLMAVMELTPSDLEHHGIKGQKWGIRRFQPYREGMKVAGGKVVGAAKKVKQRFKDAGEVRQQKKAAKAKAEAVKKAQATRKANANFEAEKKKAIESGSIEDLAKFKGKLTNEEYSKAFIRLQNEKKMSDMVAANQKTVWDTIDKGMSIVQKVGGYANTIATAKENFTKLDKAFNGEKNEDAKKAKDAIKEAEKNRALTQINNIDDLNRAQKEHNLTADEYSKGLKIISTKEAGKKVNENAFTTEEAKKAAKDAEIRSNNGVKKNASYDNSDPKDFKAPPRTLSEKAGYKNPDGETGYTRQQAEKTAVESGKRVISGFKSGTDKPVSYNSQQTLSFGESTVKKLSAKSPEPSKIVTDTRKTVDDTQAESARQRELDEKRKKALGK